MPMCLACLAHPVVGTDQPVNGYLLNNHKERSPVQTKRMIITVCFGILGLNGAVSILAEQAYSAAQAPATRAAPVAEPIEIVGKRVRNTAGDNLGVVINVLMDPSSGQITALVVGIGGVFGYGAYTYKVPWQRLKFEQDNAQLLLNVPRDKVSSEFPVYKPRSSSSHKPQTEERKPSDSGGEPGS